MREGSDRKKTGNAVFLRPADPVTRNPGQEIAAAVKQRNGQIIGTHAFIGGKMGHCAAEKLIYDQIDSIARQD